MAEEKSETTFKKTLTFFLKNVVNIIFAGLSLYYVLLAFVLQISPMENKFMLACVVGLWLLWLFAKAIVTLVLSAIVVILVLYGWYYYTHYDQIACKNGGGVWNEQKQICEEKIGLWEQIKDVWENKTFFKFSFNEDKPEKEKIKSKD